MDKVIYGADSETVKGKPNSFQFYSEHCDVDTILFVNERNATKKFFEFCESLQRKCLHVMYVHNLEFDLPEFLWDFQAVLGEQSSGEFDFSYHGWKVSGVYGKPTFARMRHEKSKIEVIIVDSYLWFQSSLAKSAEIVCPDLPKLQRPQQLGEIRYTAKDKQFTAYAMRDAVIDFHLGCAIEEMHREFDIRQAVSLADMSAKIFRHHFLHYTMPQPNRSVVHAAWQSYHGGKNNVIPNAAPRWHMGVQAFDITSAYPYAMSELPAFSNAKLYKRMPKHKPPNNGRIEVPPFGVYQVSGDVAACDYAVLFSHGFKPFRDERIRNVWVQGIELNEAMASGEFRCTSIRGTYYDSDRDKQSPALRDFVAHFFRLKATEKNPVKRYMYKIILNSLYGKFIQTRKGKTVFVTDVGAEDDTGEVSDLIAGGMFHPFIASAITAHTRAYIHQIEHAHKALHTATDGIFTPHKRVKHGKGRPRTGLGSLQHEGSGDVVILRNKLYILYSPDGKTPSQFFRGKRIAKYAKHGFQGTVYDLEKMVAYGERRYAVNRPRRLKEALKSGLTVNEFFKRPMTLKVGDIKV